MIGIHLNWRPFPPDIIGSPNCCNQGSVRPFPFVLGWGQYFGVAYLGCYTTWLYRRAAHGAPMIKAVDKAPMIATVALRLTPLPSYPTRSYQTGILMIVRWQTPAAGVED